MGSALTLWSNVLFSCFTHCCCFTFEFVLNKNTKLLKHAKSSLSPWVFYLYYSLTFSQNQRSFLWAMVRDLQTCRVHWYSFSVPPSVRFIWRKFIKDEDGHKKELNRISWIWNLVQYWLWVGCVYQDFEFRVFSVLIKGNEALNQRMNNISSNLGQQLSLLCLIMAHFMLLCYTDKKVIIPLPKKESLTIVIVQTLKCLCNNQIYLDTLIGIVLMGIIKTIIMAFPTTTLITLYILQLLFIFFFTIRFKASNISLHF